MKNHLLPADILLPDFEKVNGTAYATIACDQFTSDETYWARVRETVGENPSTLSFILPEIYLGEAAARVPAIHAAMERAAREWLQPHRSCLVYLERTQSDGAVRRGLVGMVDLEQYDYHPGAKTLIRATEATVPERIPPRLAVRRGALIETPHAMLLIDDARKTVIEPLAALTGKMQKLYEFSLMLGGGSVRAWALDSVEIGRVTTALARLAAPRENAGEGENAPLLFAVGDGNHSLATAKAAYEEIKAAHGESALRHPARYALVEVVNLHDPALRFEPIHRVLFHVDQNDVIAALERYSYGLHGGAAAQQVRFITAARRGVMHFEHPSEQLAVGTLQRFLDAYVQDHPEAKIDYIHGAKALESLAVHENTVGFLLPAMAKEQLFPTVVADGALPRKTFSMGHAEDKRYYIECRRIQ